MSVYLKAHAFDLGLAALICVVSILISVGLATIMLVRMPPMYFLADGPQSTFLTDRPAWQRVAAYIGKNALGVLLIILGVVLSLPGVPGQGILTILIGITLVDFRGKRRIERRIMSIPAVFRGANRIRARFGKPPFVLPESTSPDAPSVTAPR